MDGKTFDAATRALGMATSRRTALRTLVGLAGSALALRSGTSRAASDCSHFCRNLPPRLRGTCVSECQHGTGLFFECGGDASLLCVADDGSAANCCATSERCLAGACEEPQCSELEELCNDNAQCCSGCCDQENLRCIEGTGDICLSDGPPTCDGGTSNGGLCNDNAQCCSGCCDQENLRCIEGTGDICLSDGPPTCDGGTSNGGLCNDNSQCCSGCCDQETLRCVDAAGSACLSECTPGNPCASSQGCCTGCCGTNLVCIEGTGNDCI